MSSVGCSKGSSRGPMVTKRPDPEGRIGEVSGSKRAFVAEASCNA